MKRKVASNYKMKYIYLGNWLQEKKLLSLSFFTKLAVIDNESLTKRLTRKKNNNFRVIVKEQRLTFLESVSGYISRIPISGIGIYRSVRLEANGFQNVYAKTFFPVKSLKGKERFIRILGSRSLGLYFLNTKRFKKIHVSYCVESDLVHRFITYKNKSGTIYVDEIFPIDFRNEDINLFQARRKRR